MAMDRKLTVGFVGLGNMGWPMARNLARAGHRLVVRDADAGRQQRFAAEHGCAAADAPAAFESADAVITMLPTGRIVREVMLDWGLAAALRRRTVAVDMSSSDPAGTQALARELAGRDVALVDAPVSGGVPRAEAGTLSIMVGADNVAAIDSVRPLLEVMGKKLFLTGRSGSGHAVKALNNFVAAAGYTAAAEALIVGRKFGLDPALLVDVLNASTGRNFSTEFSFKEHVLTGKYATGFALGLLTKDIAIAADLAKAIGIEAPVCALLKEHWAETCAKMGGTVDHTAAIRHWAEVNGVAAPDAA
ncbi:MAG: NAD(P)-dependent oxidoreductase [Gammaproteobacteria bacterium]|nr:NAD(P)-dependent oxidoreductase [Gammaproteobacteria bacterium]